MRFPPIGSAKDHKVNIVLYKVIQIPLNDLSFGEEECKKSRRV